MLIFNEFNTNAVPINQNVHLRLFLSVIHPSARNSVFQPISEQKWSREAQRTAKTPDLHPKTEFPKKGYSNGVTLTVISMASAVMFTLTNSTLSFSEASSVNALASTSLIWVTRG